jgi:hypothetical protein
VVESDWTAVAVAVAFVVESDWIAVAVAVAVAVGPGHGT